jgi:hypothetical protein
MLEQPTVPDHGGDIHDEHLIVGVNLNEMLNNHSWSERTVSSNKNHQYVRAIVLPAGSARKWGWSHLVAN